MSATHFALDVRRCSLLEKKIGYFQVTVLGADVQGREVTLEEMIDEQGASGAGNARYLGEEVQIRSVIDEQMGDFFVSFLGRDVQTRVAVFGRAVHLRVRA